MRSFAGRPLTSFAKVQKLISLAIRNNSVQTLRLKHDACEYLNIGCGPNVFPGYINIDYDWRPGIDLCWDITRAIPIDKDKVTGIYTEHCLEHLSHDQCMHALRDFQRLLRPGGIARIVVPDAGMYLNLYRDAQNGMDVEFPYVGPTGERDKSQDSIAGFTPMMAVNRIFREYGHRFAYDFVTLQSMLMHVGFKAVSRESFMQGRDPRLLIDSESRRSQSLYVEAFK